MIEVNFLVLITIALGSLSIGFALASVLFLNWLLRDPDGPGGWKSRLQQLGADHDEHIKDWWGDRKK